MKRFGQYCKFFAARLIMMALASIPRCRHRTFAKILTGICQAMPQFGKVALQNVMAAFPECSAEECKRIAHASLLHLAQMSLEFLRMLKHRDEFPLDKVKIDEATAAMIEEIRQTGRQVIFITPHHGNWEFAGQFLALHFHFRMATVMKPPKNPYLCRFAMKSRAVDGVRLIFSRGAVQALRKALAEGYSIGILSDQNTRIREGAEFVPFFGLPVPVTSMPARLAIMYQMPLVIGSMQRLPDGSFRLSGAKIEPSDEPDAHALTRRIIAEVEKIVRNCPEQYLWMYRRFRYIPDDATDELKKRYPAYAGYAPASFYDNRARNCSRRTK